MDHGGWHGTSGKLSALLLAVFLIMVGFVTLQPFQAYPHAASPVATYSHGLLRVVIPYHALHAGTGQLKMEVLSPEDQIIGHTEQQVTVSSRRGQLQSEIRLDQSLPLDDLVWHRIRYQFQFTDDKTAAVEGIESISQILRMPVIHILGQQSYLTGGQAAVRVIVTDSKEEVDCRARVGANRIPGRR